MLNRMHTTSLKQLLKDEGITQEQLAKYLKINRTTVSRMLSAPEDISITMLRKILNYLNYKMEIEIYK